VRISWVYSRFIYQEMAKTIDPAIRVYNKNNRFWCWYSRVFRLNNAFMRETATVIGPLHWYPENWSNIERELHHEGRHTRQQRWFGLGIHPWLGFIPFALASMLLLPIGLSVRFWLELDAEAYALRMKFRTGSSAIFIKAELEDFAEELAGRSYLWSWPKIWAIKAAQRRALKIIRRTVR